MKKILIVVIALVLTGLVSQAQVKVQSNIGVSSYLTKENSLGWNFINMVGLEFEDKLGIEYGYSYKLNNDAQSLSNYLYGNSQSWTAGYINHLVGAYWKTKRDEGSCLNLGGGASILTAYTTEDKVIIRNKITPYVRIGLDHQFNKGWGGQINTTLGNTFAFTLGITRTL